MPAPKPQPPPYSARKRRKERGGGGQRGAGWQPRQRAPKGRRGPSVVRPPLAARAPTNGRPGAAAYVEGMYTQQGQRRARRKKRKRSAINKKRTQPRSDTGRPSAEQTVHSDKPDAKYGGREGGGAGRSGGGREGGDRERRTARWAGAVSSRRRQSSHPTDEVTSGWHGAWTHRGEKRPCPRSFSRPSGIQCQPPGAPPPPLHRPLPQPLHTKPTAAAAASGWRPRPPKPLARGFPTEGTPTPLSCFSLHPPPRMGLRPSRVRGGGGPTERRTYSDHQRQCLAPSHTQSQCQRQRQCRKTEPSVGRWAWISPSWWWGGGRTVPGRDATPPSRERSPTAPTLPCVVASLPRATR